MTAAGDRLQLSVPAWLPGLLVLFGLWLALSPSHRHLTFSVEADFPKYATQAARPLLQPAYHPFVPVGYPMLLRIATSVCGNAFRGGVALALLGGLALLMVTYLLARRYLAPPVAAYAQTLVGLNSFVLTGTLLIGTDVLWSALVLYALLRTLRARDLARPAAFAVAGLLLGLSYNLRFSTLPVLPVALLAALLPRRGNPRRGRLVQALALLLGAALGAAPQCIVAWRATGNPLANGMSANIWFGMFGQQDWMRYWEIAPKNEALGALIRMYPEPFVDNLLANLRQFAGLLISGPFGYQPGALVHRPSVGLVIATVLCGLIWTARASWHAALRVPLDACLRLWHSGEGRLLTLFALTYGLSISLAFWMTRFFVVLVPLIVIGCACVLLPGAEPPPTDGSRHSLRRVLLIILPLFLAVHSTAAFGTLLRTGQQPIDEVGIALIAGGIKEQDVVLTSSTQHYAFVLPFQFLPLPVAAQTFADLQQALQQTQASYLVYERRTAGGRPYWPRLDQLLRDPQACAFLEPLWAKPDLPEVVVFRVRLPELPP